MSTRFGGRRIRACARKAREKCLRNDVLAYAFRTFKKVGMSRRTSQHEAFQSANLRAMSADS